MSLDIELNPDDLEAEANELRVLNGVSFSHMALTESLWHDKYGESAPRSAR